MSLADAITLSRLAVVPGLVVAAVTGATTWFTGLVAFALLTDAIDGRVARWRGTAGPRGA
ncbi:MAG: CDP-alcohol phosphatidyltransferase family protein, partial [Cytophagaceae bacterium]|nr:CDP-alcohol phosphatidyltransferase family protein [Gemmatimonadaceae bacterium]